MRLGAIEELSLDVNASLLARLDAAPTPDEALEDEEDEPTAGPIAIAVDLSDASADAPTGEADNQAS